MQQVLFRIPIYTSWSPDGVPVYGFGMMLFLAFLICTWVAGRRAEKEGIDREAVQDLAIWLFLGGLLGARIVYMLQEERRYASVWEFVQHVPYIWEGGIILYGAVLGGLAAFGLGYLLYFRKQNWNTLKMADIIAPSVALGICLGRIGCFLNGCCYGQVACPDCATVGVRFPLSAPARFAMVAEGYQTGEGFTFAPEQPSVGFSFSPDQPSVGFTLVPEQQQRPGQGVRVDQVEPGSHARQAGLRPGDVIVAADGHQTPSTVALVTYLADWPRGKKEITLKIEGKEQTLTFAPPDPGLGVRVGQIEPGSPARLAGLRPGDVILAADGYETPTTDALFDYLASWPRGKKEIALKIKGKEQTLSFAPPDPGLGVRVGQVEPGSPAWLAGLRPDDVIVTADSHRVPVTGALSAYLSDWPRGKKDITLKIKDKQQSLTFSPRTLGLYPTQLFESVSMFLLFLFLTAIYPFRQREGQIMALLMVCYGIHRWINELLRNDPRPVGFESYVSLILIVCGIILGLALWRKPHPESGAQLRPLPST
jgi:prolipoprotein diacylglyceryltransferase